MNAIFKTNNDWTGLLLRLTVSIVLFPHGAQKLLGWWNGHGYDATMHYLTDTVRLPYAIGWMVIMIEFFCPLLLLVGFASRIGAMLIALVMTGIIATVQHRYFFMNWFGTQEGEGMEFFLLVIGLCLGIIASGSGKYALDNVIETKSRNNAHR